MVEETALGPYKQKGGKDGGGGGGTGRERDTTIVGERTIRYGTPADTLLTSLFTLFY